MRISEDNMTISLDVPLGGYVFTYETKCNDACAFQKDNVNVNQLSCSSDSICHTRLIGTISEKLTLQNLCYIIPEWGTRYFKTEEEAMEAGRKLVENHRNAMIKSNFSI